MAPSRSGPLSGPGLAGQLLEGLGFLQHALGLFDDAFAERSNIHIVGTPLEGNGSSSSSFFTATLKVGWLTKQASAARPKWRSRARATM
jgi:hypothetical protein